MHIGILALQGDFAAHRQSFTQLGVSTELVRRPKQLSKIQGLVIPGGESTTLLKLMAADRFAEAILDFYMAGGALFGTCAGAILLAKTVTPHQSSLSLLNVEIARNAYGRQLDSCVVYGQWHDGSEHEMVLIRAPKVTAVGGGATVLAEYSGQPMAVADGRCMIATYHPELTNDTRLQQYFLTMCDTLPTR